MFIGSAAAFRKVYEEPIVLSRQPSATAEEKRLGESRAIEVSVVAPPLPPTGCGMHVTTLAHWVHHTMNTHTLHHCKPSSIATCAPLHRVW